MDGFVLGGTASGVGKTVATLAVVQALVDEGYAVQPAKAGPDFIDPSHHAEIAGRPSRTLDLWLEGIEGTRRNYHRGSGDVCVVEGVMGLYDGEKSSTAAVAEALDLPVVLVVDASAGMESVAATALGFRDYATAIERDIDIVGVIGQQAHGDRHERGIREALPEDISYFGRIPPSEELAIPDRHLGLHRGDERPIDGSTLATAADHLAPERLLAIARTPPAPQSSYPPPAAGGRIAIARDAAFSFVYPATVERFRAAGDVVMFSPLADDCVPECDGLYLPGGYPELHAEQLAASPTVESIRELAIDGVPILGECGGMMLLGESLTATDGHTHPMAGILPAAVRMNDRYQALDYVELTATRPTLTADTGDRLRGHEFHYSSAEIGADARFAFTVNRGEGFDGDHDGLMEYQTLGTYCHIHAESGAFDRFLRTVSDHA